MINKRVILIAEIGQAHDGSLGIAHSFIDALKNIDIDIIKFQTHIAKAESSEFEPFRINFSYEDNTRFDYWNRMSFSEDQWSGIKSHCEDVGVEFMSTPTCIAAVNLLENLNVLKYKVGSGDLSNLLLIKKICDTKKPIYISAGMSEKSDIKKTINFLSENNNDYSLLACKSKYPTKVEDINLNIIREYKKLYNCPIGFSDHSGSIFPSLGAVSLGAEIIEFHVTFDKKMFGPDSSSSLDLKKVKKLVKGVRMLEKIRENPDYGFKKSEMKNMQQIFEKSLCVNKNMKKGDKITFGDLECKKPSGMGLPASKFEKVINRVLVNDKKQYEFINESDI